MAAITVGIPFSDERVADLMLAIRSIFAQTEQDWALILVGDAPRDELVALCRSITDHRVQVVVGRERRGLPYRLNELVSMTTSDFFARMDGDDIMAPERLERTVAFLREGSSDVVGTRAYLIDESNSVKGRFVESNLPKSSLGYLTGSVFSHPTVAGRTSWFQEHAYDESFMRAQDKELWARTSQISQFNKIQLPLLFYRVASDTPKKRASTQGVWDRKVIRKLGPELVGLPTTVLLLARSYVRVVLQVAVHRMGRSETVYRRRFESLDYKEAREAAKTIRVVGETAVPGWTSS